MKTPPKNLSAEAKEWFSSLQKEYGIEDKAGLLILATALESYDRLKECQRCIEREGSVQTDRHGQRKPHPLLTTERDSRSAMLQALKALNLDLEPLRDKPGRPGGK